MGNDMFGICNGSFVAALFYGQFSAKVVFFDNNITIIILCE